MGIDVNFMVGDEAGQGVNSIGFIIAKALARRAGVWGDKCPLGLFTRKNFLPLRSSYRLW